MARNRKYTEEVLQAFLECKSIREIQERTGLSRQTINKYRTDGDFQDELAKRKVAAIKAAVTKMQVSLSEIAETVLSIATDENISPQIRLNACQIVMTQCKNWTEITDILERLSALEQAVGDEKLTE